MGNFSVKKQYNNETLFLRPSPPHSHLARSPFRLLEPRRISIELQRALPVDRRGFVSVELLGRVVLLYGQSWVLVALEKGGILYDPHGCVLGSGRIRFRNLVFFVILILESDGRMLYGV
ncbi:hypothetical protein MUK42_34433 [Musa troglodytarum]|uniref:Uncharacterized protein n=1 Tax=Musa troglodytarum TaxID=320322 RepID=A0A9E7K0H5_9LILI|nr:hypothetical protein MUK42_34433 [Musa troglodytarum]